MTDELAVNATSPTPRPWPENAMATPEQLADWLEVCTRDERVDLCRRMLAAQGEAWRCFMENHDALREQVQHLSRRMAEQYEAGYRQSVEDNA